jgi:hypothetical protein
MAELWLELFDPIDPSAVVDNRVLGGLRLTAGSHFNGGRIRGLGK